MSLAKNTLSAAICGALAVYATASSAWVPTWPSDIAAPNVVIWHAGASASTDTVQGSVVEGLCDPTVTRTVTDPADSSTKTVPDIDVLNASKNFWAIACTGKSTLPASLAGKKILYNKRDQDGSGVGVGPVALGNFKIGFMKPSTGPGTNCPSITALTTVGGVANVPTWSCGFSVPATFTAEPDTDPTTTGTLQVPNIGTSDIEPSKFTFSLNVPAADFNLDGVSPDSLPSYDPSTLHNEAYTELVFGIIGNIPMYQDMQRVQFPVGSPNYADCNPAGANYGSILNAGDKANSEECMPSLTGQQVRSLTMAGRINKVSRLQAATTYGGTTYATIVATGVTDQNIEFCRRVPGSGTQAQYQAIFLGYPCDADGADGNLNTLTPATYNFLKDPYVYQGSGAGNVEDCMNDFSNGANKTGSNAALAKRWAIGIQSLEKNSDLGNAYRYFKIDGYAPTLANVHAGDYYDFVESSIQYNTSAPQAVVDTFNTIVAQFEQPAKLAVLNGSHVYPWGASGFLAPPSTTNVPADKLDLTQPIGTYQRVDFNGAPNTCALPSAYTKATNHLTIAPQNCSDSNGGLGCY